MSLILIDGFDHDDAGDVWTSVTGNVSSTSNPRTGPRHWLHGAGTRLYRALTNGQEDDGITMGSGILMGSSNVLAENGAQHRLMELGGTIHLLAKFRNSARSIQLWRGDPIAGGTLLAETEPNIWTFDTWHYFELKGKIADSGGTAEVRLNNVTVLSFTGDTRNGGTGIVDRVEFNSGNGGSAQNSFVDDVYILNEQGASPHNTFLGDIRCWPLYPNGNGFYNGNWAGSDGNSVDNYLLVDEAGTPVTSDLISSSTDGQKESFTIQDLTPTTGTVFGVEVRTHAQKSDSGARSLRPLIRRASTDAVGADVALATTWATYRELWETDPIAAAAWTITNVNGLEIGVEARP